jgi:RNA polymerase-binding transcription factor DksA
MLSKADQDTIQNRLLDERNRAIEALGEFDEEQKRTLVDRVGELSAYRLHQADLGTESMDHETQFLLASEQGERLYRIDDALRRLYDDPETFGTCRNCGAPIPMERLEVVPETDLCADCQRAAEG